MPTPSISDLDENVFFVHATSRLPLGGIMIPGINKSKTSGNQRMPILPCRFTLHWYVQGVLESHLGWSVNDKNYYILEPAKQLKSVLFGGYVEDFMSLGCHELSEDAIIFVKIDHKSSALKTLYPGYKGQVIFYHTQEEAKKLILDTIKTRTTTRNFNLFVPPNQKMAQNISVNNLLQLFQEDASLASNPEFKNVYDRLGAALQKTPVPEEIEIELDVPPEQMVVMFNGQNINAREFFSAWYGEKEGLYFGPHESSLFAKLESQAFDLTNLVLLDSHAQKEKIEKASAELKLTEKEIKKMLKVRCFPAHVDQYFEQKITIDLLQHWVPTLLEQSCGKMSSEEKIEQLFTMTTSATILPVDQMQSEPSYEMASITEPTTVRLLNSYTGAFFSAFKHLGGESFLVDAVADSKNSTVELQMLLKEKGIFSYVNKKSLVVVPYINTPMVAQAVQSMN